MSQIAIKSKVVKYWTGNLNARLTSWFGKFGPGYENLGSSYSITDIGYCVSVDVFDGSEKFKHEIYFDGAEVREFTRRLEQGFLETIDERSNSELEQFLYICNKFGYAPFTPELSGALEKKYN